MFYIGNLQKQNLNGYLQEKETQYLIVLRCGETCKGRS